MVALTEELPISQNGTFRFSSEIPMEAPYNVHILSQPSNPAQICEIAGASGTFGGNVSNLVVQCSAMIVIAQPVFSPPPGVYPSALSITITTETANANIYYTVNGSEPNCNGSGIIYSGTVFIPQPSLAPGVELRAIACQNHISSNLQSGHYTVTHGQLAMPTSSLVTNPPAPEYTSSPQVTTLVPPIGATAHYTLDGSIPTCGSPSTPNPLSIPGSVLLRAISCQADWTSSVVAEFPYLIRGTVDTPSFSHLSGTFANDVNVVLSTITPGASVRYEITNNGSDPIDPNCTTSNLFGASILINRTNTKIKAIGCLSGWIESPISAIQTYTLVVAAPALLPSPPSIIQGTQAINGVTGTLGGTVHFTVDGTPATCASPTTQPLLSAPSDGSENVVEVRAIACRDFFNTLSERIGFYTLTGTLLPPTLNPPSGAYSSTQVVQVVSASNHPSGTTYHYTANGVDPTCSDPEPGAGINIPVTTTIKVRACRTNPLWIESSVVSATYSITGTVGNPLFGLDTVPTYSDTQNLTITSPTPGAVIHYNLAVGSDPVDPTCATGATSQPIVVNADDTRIRAIACLTDWDPSAVTSATYYFRASLPTPSQPPGTYGSGLSLTYTSSPSTSLHIVWGSPSVTDPTCADTVGDSVYIPSASGSVQVKAIACLAGYQNSLVSSGIYTIGSTVPQPTISGLSDPDNYFTITQSSFGWSQQLCYTNDGSEPYCSDTAGGSILHIGGFCASGSIPIGSGVPIGPIVTTQQIRAVSCSGGNQRSNTVTQNLNIAGTLGSVLPFHGTGIKNNSMLNYSLSSTNSTHIYYTINGANPSCSGAGTLYTGPFDFHPVAPGGNTVRAIACRVGYVSSGVWEMFYNFVAAPPALSPTPPHTAVNSVTVSATSATTGADIRLTSDGSDPSCGVGSVGSVLLNAHGVYTVKAIVCKPNFTPSSIVTGTYTVNEQVATPVFSPAPGLYTSPTHITISTTTPGATIHYTLDGSTPTTASPVYSGPLHIWSVAGINMRAIAVKPTWIDSEIETSGIYRYPTIKTGAGLISGYTLSADEDGALQSGVARSFSGPNQHPTYTDDYTTTDLSTGLIWRTCVQGRTGADCSSGITSTILRTQVNTATNGCYSLNTMNSGMGYAGITNWRAPNLRELLTLMDLGPEVAPWINTTYFPGPNTEVWTTTPYQPVAGYGWVVRFSTSAQVLAGDGTITRSVRCVSGQPKPENSSFQDLGNGTIHDLSTGLVWQKCSDGLSGANCESGSSNFPTWGGALITCSNLTLAGRSWRLANAMELMGILDTTRASSPLANITYFPATLNAQYWSSNTNPNGTSAAFNISFSTSGAGLSAGATKPNQFRVRCVSGPD